MTERDGKKRVRAGSLAIIVDWPQVFPPGVWFADAMSSFSGVHVCFVFVLFRFDFLVSLKPRPLVQSFFMHAPRPRAGK